MLKPSGTFWLAIGDEYAAELKVMLQREHRLTCRSWVVWYYTFGVNCKYKFSRSHAHLFHFVKDAEHFTFNVEAIRVPSARQLVYGDSRANPTAGFPTTPGSSGRRTCRTVSSPMKTPGTFPASAARSRSAPAGTAARCPSNSWAGSSARAATTGDLVLDPFGGSGTTLAVAKKLGRRFLGFELSAEYSERIEERLARIQPGDPLDGAAEPLVSVPDTANGRRLDDRPAKNGKSPRGKRPAKTSNQLDLL